MAKEKFVIIDGHALIHRAYHALPPLTTKNGEIVNAVYGFTMILLNVLKELKPDYVAVAMDLPAPTFRHAEYAEYKATRQKADDELIAQFPLVREVINAFNIPIFQKEGYEADDVIGSVAKKLQEKDGIETFVVTGDLDELQLVDENTRVYTMRRGFTDTVIYDEAAVMEKYGLTPEEFVIYKALKGDTSDNIPGVTGIGEKSACELVAKYQTLDNIYAHLEEIRPAIAKKLEEGKDNAYLSERLSRIVTDLPIEINLENAHIHNFDRDEVFNLFRRFEFKSLLSKIPQKEVNQESLFDSKMENEKTREHFSAKCYKLINKKEDLEKLIVKIQKQEVLAIDTETNSTDEVSADLAGISLAFEEGTAYYIPVAHQDGTKQLSPDEVRSLISPILTNENIKKVGHNIKYDLAVLKRHGYDIQNIYFDTMIAAYLVNPNARALSLTELAFSELGIDMLEIEELIGKGKNQITFDCVPCDKACLYAAEDADITLRLYHKLKDEIKECGFEKLLHEMEMPLIEVLTEMELTGVKVDIAKLEKLSTEFEKRLGELEMEIYKYSKEKFNINSPAQLQKVLFDQLELQNKIESKQDLKKLPSGGYSTGADALEKLRNTGHPIIDLVIEYREVSKLKNTYVDALPNLINKTTGRIHTSFNQAVVATGRLSSSNPNLQNIPIRTKLGQEIRKTFISDPGFSILSADYSQIELRVVTHLSHDEEFIKEFNEGADIHTATAAKVYGVAEDKVNGQMRRVAKIVNFGIVYGVSAHGLERQSGLSYEEAKEFIEKYFETHNGVKMFMTKSVNEAKRKGYAETLFGRRRYLPELTATNFNIRAAAERMAMNMPVQGTAADMMKLAMIEIHKDFKKICPEAKMLLQVHDELVFEVPDKEIDALSEFIRDKMENVIKMKVPIIVNIETGKNWGEAK
jgi:DNA polymerase-1